jgi:hypothetical protein
MDKPIDIIVPKIKSGMKIEVKLLTKPVAAFAITSFVSFATALTDSNSNNEIKL